MSVSEDPVKVERTVFVGSDSEQYRSIQEALNATGPRTMILVSSGNYSSFVIRNPNIVIAAKEPEDKVLVMAEKDSAVVIDVQGEGSVLLDNIKFGHTYLEVPHAFHQGVGLVEHKRLMKGEQHSFHYPSRLYQPNRNRASVLRVVKGNVRAENCLFSFRPLGKETDGCTGAVVVESGGKASLIRCEISGHITYSTIGVILQYGKLKLEDSKIIGHLGGGASICLKEPGSFETIGCVFSKNRHFGLQICGPGVSKAINCRFFGNQGDGVQLGLAAQTLLQGCKIEGNQEGVNLASCDVQLRRNKIANNSKNGVKSTTLMGLINESIVGLNTISRNGEHGIRIEGLNNFTRVVGNMNVKLNGACGISIGTNADCVVKNNKIYYNAFQGVCVEEGAVCTLIENNVLRNMKANIALGGKGSSSSVLLKNKLAEGVAEGLYVLESGNMIAYGNKIVRNYDGAVFEASDVDFRFNKVSENTMNGVTLIRASQATLSHNIIEDNEGAGLIIKNKSKPKMSKNTIQNNEVNIFCDYLAANEEIIANSQPLSGRNLFIQDAFCTIF